MSQSLIQNLTRNMLRRIVRRTVKRQKSAGTAEVFERSWSSLLSNPLYRWALRKYASDKDHFCMNTESLKFLTRTCPELFQAVKISAPPEFIDEIRSDTPFVAVQIHDGSPNLTKFISDHKRPFSRIVRDPERHMRRLKALQLETPYINLIKRDVRSFSRLRNAIQDRHIICCAIDYKDEDGKWGRCPQCKSGDRKSWGQLKLANPGRQVTDLLQFTKLYTVFDVHESEDDALKSFSN